MRVTLSFSSIFHLVFTIASFEAEAIDIVLSILFGNCHMYAVQAFTCNSSKFASFARGNAENGLCLFFSSYICYYLIDYSYLNVFCFSLIFKMGLSFLLNRCRYLSSLRPSLR